MNEYIDLLDRLIATPSVSREEDATAALIESFLTEHGVDGVHRLHNNVWAKAAHWDDSKPTLLLNAHHDTVKPNPAYTRNPFDPTHEDGRIYGLGSNDDGASLVSLMATFCHFYSEALPFNLLLALTAEEEVTGVNGSRALVPYLISHLSLSTSRLMAIVGEPTRMQCAIAERGLMVLDGVATGRAGHAARNEGINALYIALDDIQTLRRYQFERESAVLGPIKVTTTQISAGTQHNVVPAECRFVVDVRTTDAYTNEQVAELLQREVQSVLTPRSTHIRASAIDSAHPLVQTAERLGIPRFVSPTTSDQCQMPFPSIKMGPGDSARSHTADEWVGEQEIADAIGQYVAFIESLATNIINSK